MQATRDSIAERIRLFVSREFQVPEDDAAFTADAHLFESGYVDSLGLVRLIAFIESSFGMKLAEQHLFNEEFTSINGIARLVEVGLHEMQASSLRGNGAAPAGKLEAAPGRPALAASRPEASRHGAVRAFEEDDLEPVAALYELVMRSGGGPPPRGLVDCFRRFFLLQPHIDPELPSLVYEDVGGVVGFLGLHSRRFHLDGRLLRMACGGQFVVHPQARSRGVGLQLLRAFLAGAQDFTITDGATPEVGAMWERLGGYRSPLGNIRWTRIFRPWAFAAAYGASRPRLGRYLSPLEGPARPLTSCLDALTRRIAGRRFRTLESGAALEELTAKKMLQGLEALAPHARLLPAYDEAFLDWLFREVRDVRSRGVLRANLLRRSDGRIRGWYLYYLNAGGISRTLQVAALPGEEEAVLEDLFSDADAGGSLALQGRMEARLLQPLSRLGASLQAASSRAYVHSRSPELLAVLLAGDSLLTRLEGEWWTGFHRQSFQDGVRSQQSAPTGG